MNQRAALTLALTAMFVGSKLSESLGEKSFYWLIALGFVAAIGWTIVAYRRGEPVFFWQNRNG